jgi:hypothetical protein
MNMSRADCRDETRRQLIRDRKLNGVDYVDVVGSHLCVHFLTGIPQEFRSSRRGVPLSVREKKAAMAHIVVSGGRRVSDIRVVDIDPEEASSSYEESCLGIELDKAGDWSTYTLCFVDTKDGKPTDRPLKSLDARYACLEFSFKVDCAAEIDCKTDDSCAITERPAPAISYMAKDYATFRQLILDRMALTMPEWRERHVPDIGIAIVEVLAYVGDYLSYFQDAVATEQYLETARQRVSVRRHARLVDYIMHEGCNARAFVHVQVSGDVVVDRHDLYFVTGTADGAPVLRESTLETMTRGWLAFEPLLPRPKISLRMAHNAIRIYTWGDEECCLPKGATRATLLDEYKEKNEYDPGVCDDRPWPPRDHHHHDGCECRRVEPRHDLPPRALDLHPGDFLLFEELACAATVRTDFDGTSQPDADKTHRHVVRLTKVGRSCDPVRGNRVLEVEWCREDALPFALCVSGIGAPPECDLVENLAVARGNIVLADHGLTVDDEPLPPVETTDQSDVCEGEDVTAEISRIPRRYRPVLRRNPLTFSEPIDSSSCAATAVRQNPRAALPAVYLNAIPASFDTEAPLFPADVFRNPTIFAETLMRPETSPQLDALRVRLSSDVRAMLDKRVVTEELITSLEANLRDLTERWTAHSDLLESNGDDRHFVAEIDDDGAAHLRFGDGSCGRAIEPGMAFVASYRTGNGRSGLVGPESIVHAVFRRNFNDVITAVRNPLASIGAVAPEPVQEAKAFAPTAFRKDIARAVTAADYAALAQRLRFREPDTRLQSTSAALQWTGSWYEAAVALDPVGTSDLNAKLRTSVEHRLERYRRMGHDLSVGSARIVPIRLVLDLCVKPDYLRAHVARAVLDVLSSRVLPGGKLGFFHPDRLTFGEAVYVSRIIAAVMTVDGVTEVHVVALERLAHERQKNPDIDKGLLVLASNEIARLDNDPAMPENGILTLRHVRGGR